MIVRGVGHLFIRDSTQFAVKNEYELKKVIKVLEERYGYVLYKDEKWALNKYRSLAYPEVSALNNIKKIIIDDHFMDDGFYKAEVLFSNIEPIY